MSVYIYMGLCLYRLSSAHSDSVDFLEGIHYIPITKAPYTLATYRENGQGEPHCVEDSGCDGTVMERILDAVIITEKASLIRFYFGQV